VLHIFLVDLAAADLWLLFLQLLEHFDWVEKVVYKRSELLSNFPIWIHVHRLEGAKEDAIRIEDSDWVCDHDQANGLEANQASEERFLETRELDDLVQDGIYYEIQVHFLEKQSKHFDPL